MASFSNNYRGGKEPDICKLCGLHIDCQEISFECPKIREAIKIDVNYSTIYRANLQEVIKLANIFMKINKLRED